MGKDFVQMDLFGGTAAAERDFNEEMRQQIAARDGINPKCKHLSIWNKRICNNCHDCIDFSSEESIARRRHPETGTDGVTSDRFESFKVPLPGKIKAEVEIRLSWGDSGSWYFGLGLKYGDTGEFYAAVPKFSDKYATRYSAFWFAAKKALEWFEKMKVKPMELRIIRALIIDTANYSGLMGPDSSGSPQGAILSDLES